MKTRRRSGISTLIGAVFFIVIVVLVVGSLSALFTTFNTSITNIHQGASGQINSASSPVQVQNATFGGVSFVAKGQVAGVPNTAQTPITPVSNMNFTGGMSGWYMSKSFAPVGDSATVTEMNQNFQLSTLVPAGAPETFSLIVLNADPLGGLYSIVRVELLADRNLPLLLPPLGSPPGWGGLPSVGIGNNLTWTAQVPNSIAPQHSVTFSWEATVPAVVGTYYNTVVVSWATNGATTPYAYTDTAIATVNATVTVAPSGGSSLGLINASPVGAVPGGLSAGYDADATTTSSESGPGSLYIEYQPTYGGQPLLTGQQLLSTVNFAAPFYLDGSTVADIQAANCCTVTWASSLDGLASYRNSLVVYHVYLENPNGLTWTLDVLNPTLLNNFGPSGWDFKHTPQSMFVSPALPAGWTNPSTGYWYVGTYQLILSVESILPGASLGHLGYPTSLTEHFDDIGLGLKPITTSYYGSTRFQIYTGLNASQIQGMEVLVNMTGATANTTAYGYLTDNSRFAYNPQLHVQFGSVTFSSAASIHAVIPLPNAAYYDNGTAYMLGCGPRKCDYANLIVNASSASAFTLQTTIQLIVQTTNQKDLVVAFTNQGDASLHLVSLYVTGPNGVAVFSSSLSPDTFNLWVDGGSRVYIFENLAYPASGLTSWIPGQQYTVTVTTSTGLVYSKTFTAPIA